MGDLHHQQIEADHHHQPLLKINSSIRRKISSFLTAKNIIEQCDPEALMNLHNKFGKSNGKMSESKLHEMFIKILKISLNDNEFHELFEKMKSKSKDDNITWEEFISYIIYEIRVKSGAKDLKLDFHHQNFIYNTPEIINNIRHKNGIVRIIFLPKILSLKAKKMDYKNGFYVTASSDSTINFWNVNFLHKRKVKCFEKKTMILDVVAMPDVQMICVSSIDSQLSFYDAAANKFDLKLVIKKLPELAICLSYYTGKIDQVSYLILGDNTGSVIVMSLNSVNRGPFKQEIKPNTQHFNYQDVLKGAIKQLSVIEFKNIHTEWVSQVAYYGRIRSLISCSRCSKCSLRISDPLGNKMQYIFQVQNGITCFTVHEEKQLLFTGGPDHFVRLWNPFVPTKANAIFHGHQTTIISIVVESNRDRLYTISKDKYIKVWDIITQICIYTYNFLRKEMNGNSPISVFYDSEMNKLIIGSKNIIILKCEKISDNEISHQGSVTCIIYNPLFKSVQLRLVTTGTDSRIITWHPWNGNYSNVIKNAHTKTVFEETIAVEITAATFDPTYQLLATGCQNGTFKIWDFNYGNCIKMISIKEQCEITGIVWTQNKIICVGLNKRIVEIENTQTELMIKKSWEKIHTDEIISISCWFQFGIPKVLVSASQNGQLIFWCLDEGKPYKRHEIFYLQEDKMGQSILDGPSSVSTKKEKSVFGFIKIVSICTVLFLSTRPMNAKVGTVLVSLSSGLIQLWSHHPEGSFIEAFNAVHQQRDYCLSLTTDPLNEYLITGSYNGYIKVWLIKNYHSNLTEKINIPALKLNFSFLMNDRINGRAKRAIKDQPLPILLTSFKAHLKPINSIEFISRVQLIISGSDDCSVRLWSLNGQYINTFGQFKNWNTILPEIPINTYYKYFKLPIDITETASSTTLKVLTNGLKHIEIKESNSTNAIKKLTDDEKNILYGKRLDIELDSNRNYNLSFVKFDEKPMFDCTLPVIQIYSHLKAFDLASLHELDF